MVPIEVNTPIMPPAARLPVTIGRAVKEECGVSMGWAALIGGHGGKKGSQIFTGTGFLLCHLLARPGTG